MDAEAEVEEGAEQADTEAGPQSVPAAPQDGKWWEGGTKKETAQEFNARRLDTPLDKLTRQVAGRRSVTKTDRKRGRYIQSRLPQKDKVRDLAFDATLRVAAAHQKRRAEEGTSDLALKLTKQDLREKVRVLEENAKRKEQILAVTKNSTIDQNDQVNDMIYESIKAKLSILDEFNS